MKRIVRLTESDLTRIVRRVIMEQATSVKVSIGPNDGTDNLTLTFDKTGTNSTGQKTVTFVGNIAQGSYRGDYKAYIYCNKNGGGEVKLARNNQFINQDMSKRLKVIVDMIPSYCKS